jgi:protein-disulfide isomerase
VQVGPLLDEAYVATGKVLHVFRNFPLPELGHTNAIPAANAAYCAGQQAPRLFWGMHDWIFANQSSWASAGDAAAQFRKQALALGADGAQYDACLTASETAAAIQRDQAEGYSLGVQGTPAFFINDWFLGGAYPYEEFQKVIEKAAQGLHPPPTPTPLPPGVAFYDPDPAHPGLTYDGSPTLGEASAPIMLLAFEDFKSSACAQYATTIEPALRDKYVQAGQLRIVFKVFPVSAPKAAAAALCAAGQGQFWEFESTLFAKQAEWQEGDNAAMAGYARSLGLDEAKFNQCLADPATQVQVDAATEFGQQVGVPDVPAFLIVDLRQNKVTSNIVGAQPLEEFASKIESALNPPTPTPAAATPTPGK